MWTPLAVSAALAALACRAAGQTGRLVVQTDAQDDDTEFESIAGELGPGLPVDGITGTVSRARAVNWTDGTCIGHASPDCDFACGPIHGPNLTAPFETGAFLALIQRSPRNLGQTTCSFETKVINAQNAGYAGVIVYDSLDNEQLERMKGDGGGRRVNISSVFISRSAGQEILLLMQTDNVTATMYPNMLTVTNFLFTFVTVIATTSVIFTLFLFYRRHMLNYRRAKRKKMTRRQVMKLPTRCFKPEDADETCVICLENFKPGNTIMILPCGHIYHKKCITPWLSERQRLCCICKRDPALPPPDPTSVDESTPLLSSSHDQNRDHGALDSDSMISDPTDQEFDADGVPPAVQLSINVASEDTDSAGEGEGSGGTDADVSMA